MDRFIRFIAQTVERCQVNFHLFLIFPMLIVHINYVRRKWNEVKRGIHWLVAICNPQMSRHAKSWNQSIWTLAFCSISVLCVILAIKEHLGPVCVVSIAGPYRKPFPVMSVRRLSYVKHGSFSVAMFYRLQLCNSETEMTHFSKHFAFWKTSQWQLNLSQ